MTYHKKTVSFTKRLDIYIINNSAVNIAINNSNVINWNMLLDYTLLYLNLAQMSIA